jgi:hypothetical protein
MAGTKDMMCTFSFVYFMGNDVLPATQIAGLVSRAVFLIACEEEMYIPLISLMEGAEPIHIDCIV